MVIDTSSAPASLRPLDDRILVLPDEPVTQTEAGIYIPEVHQDRSTTGTVVAVGPGKLLSSGKRSALSVRPGDTVMYTRFAGSEVLLDDGTGNKVEHQIMRVSEVLAVLPPGETEKDESNDYAS